MILKSGRMNGNAHTQVSRKSEAGQGHPNLKTDNIWIYCVRLKRKNIRHETLGTHGAYVSKLNSSAHNTDLHVNGVRRRVNGGPQAQKKLIALSSTMRG